MYIDGEGEVTDTDVAVGENDLGEVIAGAVDEPIMAIAGAEPGAARVDETDGRMILTAGREGVVSGEGFEPESEVEIWICSEPRLIGVVTVDADGTFEERFDVPTDIAIGDHTIQAEGTARGGGARAISAGVELQADVELPATGSDVRYSIVVIVMAIGTIMRLFAMRSRGTRW